jgi:hypothetical protein
MPRAGVSITPPEICIFHTFICPAVQNLVKSISPPQRIADGMRRRFHLTRSAESRIIDKTRTPSGHWGNKTE